MAEKERPPLTKGRAQGGAGRPAASRGGSASGRLPATRAETPELRRLRAQIDRVDLRIVRLLNERASLGLAVGAAKRASGRRGIRDLARERRVLERIARLSPGPLPEEDLLAIYRGLIAAIRRLQQAPAGDAPERKAPGADAPARGSGDPVAPAEEPPDD